MRHDSRKWTAIVVGLLTITFTSGAFADAGPGVQDGIYFSPGGPLGLSFHDSSGGVLGVEGSVVSYGQIHTGVWLGAYGDVLRDFAHDSWRMSVGPEVGFTVFGLDGGYLVEQSPAGSKKGWTARLLFTLGVAALYARSGLIDNKDWFGEYGILVKFPLLLVRQPSHWETDRRRDSEQEEPDFDSDSTDTESQHEPPGAQPLRKPPDGPYAKPPPGRNPGGD